MRRAIVIGAGFGGLALAIRLQSAGVATTIVEARAKPGGRAYHWTRDGFTFDAGPTVITDPPCLRELWALSGQDMARDVDLVPVMPFYRLDWPDGSRFDYAIDEAALRAELQTWVRERLRSSRVPAVISFREQLPYNEMGKILRRVLRDELSAAL